MKKTIAMVLCLMMVLSMFCGCGPTEQPGGTSAPETTAPVAHTLQVGYGRADITPPYSVPLGGRHTEDFSETVDDNLFATCIAFTDETGNTILLYQLDLLFSFSQAMMARVSIAKATGVNGLQIMVTSTHNHSAPNLSSSNANIERYAEEVLKPQMVEAAKAAMDDRKPVKSMQIARTYPEGLNFLRHYILKDGTKVGWASPVVQAVNNGTMQGHLFDADNEMQLLKFVRDGGKDVVLMNWQGHPRAHDAKYAIRADTEAIRQQVEPLLDCHFAYILGASGNVNSSSKIPEEVRANDYRENAKLLAQYAAEASTGFKEVKIGKLQLVSYNHPGKKPNSEITTDIPLYAFSLGDVAFATAPYEMFTENGKKVKADSPFEMTFMASCSNGNCGYIPSSSAFDYDCYEVSITRYARGTAEDLVESHVNMLKQLYETKD